MSKKEFRTCPEGIDETKLFGFSWMEHVAAIPSPLMLVTTYKASGKTNATMQSWSAFANHDGFYAIFGSVYKAGHMYRTIQETKALVIKFPDASVLPKCMETIRHNQEDDDEIAATGLTAEPAATVNAPRVKECFLNLECEYVWEKEIVPGSGQVVMCVKVLNLCMDEARYNDAKMGRYGETGYLYNIHSPRNPESGEVSETCVGILKKYGIYGELPG